MAAAPPFVRVSFQRHLLLPALPCNNTPAAGARSNSRIRKHAELTYVHSRRKKHPFFYTYNHAAVDVPVVLSSNAVSP